MAPEAGISVSAEHHLFWNCNVVGGFCGADCKGKQDLDLLQKIKYIK